MKIIILLALVSFLSFYEKSNVIVNDSLPYEGNIFGEEKNTSLKYSSTPLINIRYYEDIIQNDPTNAEAHYRLGEAYSELYSIKEDFKTEINKTDGKNVSFEKFIDNSMVKKLYQAHFDLAYNPSDAEFYYKIGKLYESIGIDSEIYKKISEKHYDVAIKLGYNPAE
jgi:TPR repeat protein